MDLLETLSLAMALEVNLELRNGRLRATPKENVTEDLRQGITGNLDELKEHLKQKEKSWQYELLTAVAVAGITLRLKPDGRIYASPREAVEPLRSRIAQNKQFLADTLRLDEDKKIATQVEARTLVRQRFDTRPFEPVQPVNRAVLHTDKARFFKGGEE